METNGNTKTYYGKKSIKLLVYIIIATISLIIGCSIEGDISGYFILLPIITLPLGILFLIDTIKFRTLKIQLDETTLKINTRKEKGKEINYTNILIIYIISWNTYNEEKIQIVEKGGYIFTEINTIYIKNSKDLLTELNKKGIIICNINIMEERTNDINNKNTIFRGPMYIPKNGVSQEPYAIARDITKYYRGVPDDKIEEFEKKNGLTNLTVKYKDF